MRNVVVGLLQGLGGWLLVAAGVSWGLQQHYGLPALETSGMGLLVSALLWPALGLVLSALRCAREMQAIRRGAAGPPPVDGADAVLVGVIEAIGQPLRAPLDRAPCVAYSYEVLIDRGSGRNRTIVKVARGVGLVPCQIRTARGSYKLLVVPDLEAVPSAASQAQLLQNFVAYADKTSFIEGRESAQELVARWADDDGSYRSDVRFIPTTGADTTLWQARQQQVPPGAQVALFGRYSQARGGIVPTGLKPVRLVCGKPAEVVASLRSKLLTRSLLAVLVGAAAVGALAAYIAQTARAVPQ